MTKEATGADIVTGTLEEARTWIGKKTPVKFNETDVNRPMIQFYAAAVEDANPSYWDEEYAGNAHGGIISPPGMLMAWSMTPDWNPMRPKSQKSQSTFDLPLPGTTLINVSTESEFFRPMRIGEILNSDSEIVSISDEKKTRLGIGHFIVTQATYRSGAGEIVATNTNTMFRYIAHGENHS
ncbi:MAG: MaoC family dehydratase N-terminal domain-containing protein [Pseudomonadales bacterium]|nr:MaoC family dehydratase N-terminal domain-containing protein [Pseudomonadales bacterium]